MSDAGIFVRLCFESPGWVIRSLSSHKLVISSNVLVFPRPEHPADPADPQRRPRRPPPLSRHLARRQSGQRSRPLRVASPRAPVCPAHRGRLAHGRAHRPRAGPRRRRRPLSGWFPIPLSLARTPAMTSPPVLSPSSPASLIARCTAPAPLHSTFPVRKSSARTSLTRPSPPPSARSRFPRGSSRCFAFPLAHRPPAPSASRSGTPSIFRDASGGIHKEKLECCGARANAVAAGARGRG